jgi:hypothetical protein
MNRLSLLLVCLMVSACETFRATELPTPKERVTECEALCSDVGLEMTALVVMMNRAGCVCEKRRTTPTAAAATTSGGATIAAVQEAARQVTQSVQSRSK